MKNNAPRRKLVEDAIDLYTPSIGVPKEGDVFMEIPIARIKPYHDHPFQLYAGDRLDDMVESIKEHGVIVPVIVQPLANGCYEMLAGHNRMNAAQLAGLTTISAIVKEGLTPEEAYYYVIETNLIQRGFAELSLTEQAAVLSVHYSQMISQGKRNDIDRELRLLAGQAEEETVSSENTESQNSRKEIAETYSLSSSTVARLLKINDLLPEFKDRLDKGKIPFMVSVEISYLSSQEQQWLLNFLSGYKVKLDRKSAEMLHRKSRNGGLTEESIRSFMLANDKEKASRKKASVKMSKSAYSRFFSSTPADQVENIVVKALELYFQSKEGMEGK